MKNRKRLIILLLILIGIVSNICIIKKFRFRKNSTEFKLSYILTSDKQDLFQVFYSSNNNEFSEDKSVSKEYQKVYRPEKMEFLIPSNTRFLRLDFGNKEQEIKIEKFKIEFNGNVKEVNLTNKENIVLNNEIKIDKNLDFKIIGKDPYLILNSKNLMLDELSKSKLLVTPFEKMGKVFLCLIVDLFLFVLLKSRSIKLLIEEIRGNEKIIINLSKNDFKTKFAGSYLGIVWAFVTPIVTTLVYWFVFEFGLKVGSQEANVPFILWLMAGLIPWFFFSEGLNSATNCMLEYSYLVKKVVFKISILPIVRGLSSLFIHFIFIGFLFLVAFFYKFYPTVYTLQIVYYLFCLFMYTLALSYSTSAIVLFFKDLGQIINILLQIGIWVTPIMWNYNIVPENYRWVVKLNPMVYIVEGYREVFTSKIWFWDKQGQTMYFWIICFGMFVIGLMIFRRLRLHFADVL